MTARSAAVRLGDSEPFLPPPHVRILGVRIDCLTLGELMRRAAAAAETRTRLTIMYVNVHCMNVAAHDPEYAGILDDADLVYCDGTGVRLAGWLLGEPVPERMTGADWIHNLARTAVREGLSIYLVGGWEGSAAEAARALAVRHPGLRIAGCEQGYDRGEETVHRINASGADILLVGMGTPTQERWIAQYREDIDVPVVWAVGALFDFVNGRIARGPSWLTDNGFEWLCRLVVEPRKLWRRYLLGNPVFFWRVFRARLR